MLLLTGLALVVAGLAFKASVAPFHQWTPDVYEGAPTAITAFMAVATKAAAFGVIIRFFDVAVIGASDELGAGARGARARSRSSSATSARSGSPRSSGCSRTPPSRRPATCSPGVVVTTQLGARAVVFYLAVYLFMNMAAFAVIVARERETGVGDDISSLYGLGEERPLLAWPMTIAMLALAGFPATAGFFGKVYLIGAAVDNGYAWLGVAIVARLGDLARLLPARRGGGLDARAGGARPRGRRRGRRAPAIAGGSAEADPGLGATVAGSVEVEELDPRQSDRLVQPEVVALAVLCAAATMFFGVYPEPAARPRARCRARRSLTRAVLARGRPRRSIAAAGAGENSRALYVVHNRGQASTEYVAILLVVGGAAGAAARRGGRRGSASGSSRRSGPASASSAATSAAARTPPRPGSSRA